MAKKLIFISHIHEEADLATAIKTLVEESFLGMMDVFVSSDSTTITSGAKWLEEITRGLKTCDVEIILCSPASIKRPWINFEAGAGWVRDIPVIPICHSGLALAGLPVPLSLLDGADATDSVRLGKVMKALATALGANAPKTDLGPFIATAAAFEKKYTFWTKCNASLRAVMNVHATVRAAILSGKGVDVQLPDPAITAIDPHLAYLRNESILDGQRNGVAMTPNGTSYLLQIRPLGQLPAVLKDKEFKP
jgi:hypothetical protein